MLYHSVKAIAGSFLDLLYPPQCIHCNGGLQDSNGVLCVSCAELLDRLDPTERCQQCFSGGGLLSSGYCYKCSSKTKLLSGCASVFDYVGPASSIIKKMKYSDMPFLGKGVAAYMVTQFLSLDWPIPDVIIPVPLSLSHKVQRGYNQSLIIANELGRYLQTEVSDILLRRNGSYSQAGLLRFQREQLAKDTFYLKTGRCITDKRILLIDDVYTTGSTLRASAEAICEGYPKEIYALTFCRAY